MNLICKNRSIHENFEILLRDLNVILTVTQGTHGNVNTNKLKQLGIDIMSHIKTKFINVKGEEWVPINHSLHLMCAHSWELLKCVKDQFPNFLKVHRNTGINLLPGTKVVQVPELDNTMSGIILMTYFLVC
ncbi:unnamed protein product [Meganyctiphanes norvegica]|uniref:Uncharacterized protein n=1 Tax=Meganyctiphanes norvegica TaxID=48144 RepID=A0AAV2PXJ4_MEGNR